MTLARAASLDTPSTSPQDEREKQRGGTRLARRDATKAAMADALRAWTDAVRWRSDLPSWAVEPIPVPDFVDVPGQRGAMRVAGGSTITPAEWIGRRAAGLEECRVVRAFRDATCGRWIVQASSCHTRTCPDCESQRASRAIAIYANVAAGRMSDPRFVTLTIPNVPRGELRAAIRRLRRLTAQLLRRGLVKGGRCRYRRACGAVRSVNKAGRPRLCPHPAKAHAAREDGSRPLMHEWRSRCEAFDPERGHGACRGGIVSIEVTFNDDAGTWHPHAHLLIDGPFLPWAELRASWLDLTTRDGGAPGWIVDVERVRDRTGRGMEAAIRETVKYATKPSPALVAADGGAALAELLLALRGARLVSAFGSLHGLAAEELDPDVDDDAETVRVADPDDPFRAWRLPKVCPHADERGETHDATWTDATWTGRGECYRVRAGPRSYLAWSGP